MQICINYNRSASNTYTDFKMRKVREIPSSQWLIQLTTATNKKHSQLHKLHQLLQPTATARTTPNYTNYSNCTNLHKLQLQA